MKYLFSTTNNSTVDCLEDLFNYGVIPYLMKHLDAGDGPFTLSAARGLKNMCIHNGTFIFLIIYFIFCFIFYFNLFNNKKFIQINGEFLL